MTENLNSVFNEFENTIQRSQRIASQAHHLNKLQTKQLEQCQTTMDKSSKHLRDVEHEINEIEKGFCMRLCCSSKTKKRKSKEFLRNKSQENFIDIEDDSSHSNDQLKNLDANLRKLQDFNLLIDKEMQNQIQTFNHLHHEVDLDSYKLSKANVKTKQL